MTASENFRVDIFYIPTTLEVYVEVQGCVFVGPRGSPASVHPSAQSSQESLGTQQDTGWVLSQLQNTQEYPGKFVKFKENFVSLLASLNHCVGGNDDLGNGPGISAKVEDGGEDETQPSASLSPPAKKMRRMSEIPTEATASDDSSLILNPLLTCSLPGKVIARIGHPMETPERERSLSPSRRQVSNFWLLELAIPLSGDVSVPSGVRTPELIHRRLEWFAHFFIDTISNIPYDVRWRVFLPIRFMAEEDPLERVMNETQQFNELTGNVERDADVQHLAHKINEEWPQLRSTTVEQFSIKLAGSPGEKIFESNVAMDAIIQDPPCPVELLGLVTVFQFFALPRDRARISQFFILPHRQRAGLGRQVHTCMVELFCADERIRQINVEDPAPGYQRVRDVASIDLGISNRILTVECLYPTAELKAIGRDPIAWTHFPANPAQWRKYRHWFANMQKETPAQRRRIRLLLRIARLVPSELLKSEYMKGSEQPLTEVGEHGYPQASRRHARPTPDSPEENPLIGWQRNSEEMSEIRVNEKRRFRVESLDWYSNQRSVAEVQIELENEWQQLLKALCSSIASLRRIFVLKAPTERDG